MLNQVHFTYATASAVEGAMVVWLQDAKKYPGIISTGNTHHS